MHTEVDLISQEAEDIMLADFGESFLQQAIHIINTKELVAPETEILHKALCITVALYMRKLTNGDMAIDRVIH